MPAFVWQVTSVGTTAIQIEMLTICMALDQGVVVYMFYVSIICDTLLSMIICWLPQYTAAKDETKISEIKDTQD